MRKLIILFILLSQLLPAQTSRRIALVNGTAHIGDGRVIDRSIIVMNGQLIESVSSYSSPVLPAGLDTVYDVSGKHVYPSLINTNNVLGLHDAEAVRATVDFAEVGHINPHIRSLIAYNTDNIIIPTVKTNGILYTQVTPRAGLISGSSSVMALEGWNWEDAVLKADDGIHLSFPQVVLNKFVNADAAIVKEAQKRYDEELEFLEKFFTDARAYCSAQAPGEKNIRFEAMRPVFNGASNLYVHANEARNILAALGFITRHAIPRSVLVGGRDSYLLTAELRSKKIPVMLGRTNDLPVSPDDDVDIIFRLPFLLQRDSVLFCIQMEGDMEAMNSRNLPFNAGAAVAYGLTREQALAAVTSNAAKILGVTSHIGTIEAGKLASVVVSEGDILDMRTNNITLAFLAGRPVNLFNHQTGLYNRYKNKYGIK